MRPGLGVAAGMWLAALCGAQTPSGSESAAKPDRGRDKEGQAAGMFEAVWRSGETLPGYVLSSEGDSMVFQPRLGMEPELFAEPVRLSLARVGELRRWNEGSAPELAREEAFRVRLRDGTEFLADWKALDGDRVVWDSALLGTVRVRREEVMEVVRVRGPDLFFSSGRPGVAWSESLRLEPGANGEVGDPFAEPADPFAPAEAPRVRRVNRSGNSGSDEPRLWQRQPGGGLKTLSWGNKLSAPVGTEADKLPQRWRVELALRAEAALRFRFGAEVDGQSLSLQTWGERLVLRVNERFVEVRQPGSPASREGWAQRSLRLALLWDRERGAAVALTEWGEELARLESLPEGKARWEPGRIEAEGLGDPPRDRQTGRKAEGSAKQPMLSLENLGRDLELESLSIAVWRDTLPPTGARQLDAAGATLFNGRWLAGEWSELTEGRLRLLSREGAVVEVAVGEILRLRTGAPTREEPPQSPKPLAAVTTRAGEVLRGAYAGMETVTREGRTEPEQRVRLLHQAVEGGWSAGLRGLESVRWPGWGKAGDEAEAGAARLTDRLRAGEHAVRGRLASSQAGEKLPRWWFDGAAQAVPLAEGAKAVIQRQAVGLEVEEPMTPPVGARVESHSRNRVLLGLQSGDLLPARLEWMSPEGAGFLAPGVLPTTLPPTQLRAVIFPRRRASGSGFVDAGWRDLGQSPALPPAAERGDADLRLTLKPGQRVGHPDLLAGEGLDLVLHEEEETSEPGTRALRLSVYLRRLEDAGKEQALRLMVAQVGDEIYCGDEHSDGQLRHQAQTMRMGEETRVGLRVRQNRVVLLVNGTELLNFEPQPGWRAGTGVTLESGALWGNTAQTVRISQLRVQPPTEAGQIPGVELEAREQLLTIPRARREEPPHHALISSSGDLLRGTVESIGETSLRLRWGLESWEVPRERVAALMVLEPAAPEVKKTAEGTRENEKGAAVARGPSAPATPRQWLLLEEGGRLGVNLAGWAEDGVAARHGWLGRMKVAPETVREIWLQEGPPSTPMQQAMTGWQLRQAPDPELPEEEGSGAKLTGVEAKDFTLPLAGGGTFRLGEARGRVVVLDFWASWCGPCLKALPELMAALKELPSDQVRLVGVNQAEPEAQVTAFLQTRRWELVTALDAEQAVARQFGVEGIPHTVVIGPDGKVALVKTGYSATAAREVVEKARELLRAAGK